MKSIIITIILILSINVAAQNEPYSDTFVRVYNLEGKKINKGKIKSISENSLTLFCKKKTTKIHFSKIGKIKTNRSFGNNIAKGALIGSGSLAFLGFSSGDDKEGIIAFSAIDKASAGLIVGGFLGSIVGGITYFFKKSKHYIIDGNGINFENFKEQMKIPK